MSSGGDSIRMCGLAAFFRCGMQYFDTMKVPRVLMPIIRSNRFMSVACESVRLMALALLTQMSMPPNSATVWFDRRDHLGFVADIAQDRQRLAAGGADLVGGGIDGAFQLRMRLGGLGGDRDIGAVPRGAQRDRQPDAAAAAGYEQRLAFEVESSDELPVGFYIQWSRISYLSHHRERSDRSRRCESIVRCDPGKGFSPTIDLPLTPF